MSYDISIRPKVLDGKLDKVDVRSHLTELGLVPDSEAHFLFIDAGTIYADMDLAWCEAERCDEPVTSVNRLQVHIPGAYVETMLADVIRKSCQIGERLGWLVYDEQSETYL